MYHEYGLKNFSNVFRSFWYYVTQCQKLRSDSMIFTMEIQMASTPHWYLITYLVIKVHYLAKLTSTNEILGTQPYVKLLLLQSACRSICCHIYETSLNVTKIKATDTTHTHTHTHTNDIKIFNAISTKLQIILLRQYMSHTGHNNLPMAVPLSKIS